MHTYLLTAFGNSDYVDELVANLQHNIEINRSPRAGNKILDPPSSTAARDEEKSAAVFGAVKEKEPRGGRQRQRQRHQQAGGGISGSGRELAYLRRLSRSRVRACKLDWTEYEHGGTRDGRGQDGDARGGGNRTRDWWWDDTGRGCDGLLQTCIVYMSVSIICSRYSERHTSAKGGVLCRPFYSSSNSLRMDVQVYDTAVQFW